MNLPQPHSDPPGAAKPPARHVRRPWGAFEQYARNQPCTVSLMIVQPGKRLSLQAHAQRAELWIVLDQGAWVQIGDHARPCDAGEEIWIPAGQKHRLACRGPNPVRVLEVAFGQWHQQDITRYEDDFGRPQSGE